MRVLLQRVTSASVEIDQTTVGRIGRGLLVFVGIEAVDTNEDIEWLCGKISRMRIFEDGQGKMNRSVIDAGGSALVVSQFTLHATVKKGNRPSFLKAANPTISEPMFRQFCEKLSESLGKKVEKGQFAADMKVALINDGPVTIWIDSKARE
ncbi:MAG: D-aminoacyl-tRNA deacylase [Akkermansiaceae bacterium]